MAVALSLVAYGTLLGTVGGRVLHRLPGVRRSPRLGVVMWQVAAVSTVLSWILAGVALAVPIVPLDDLGHLLTTCLSAMHEVAAGSARPAVRVAGLLVSGAIAVRVIWCVGIGAATAYRRRLRHARMLRIVGRPAPKLGAVVVEHPDAAVYCLPGRLRQTVITRGAIEALSPDELAAVLAHERAHLRARHHLAVVAVRGLARAVPGVPLLSAAADEVPALIEMCADDAAARRHGSAAVMGALRALARMRAPAGALAAGGTAAEARIARLARPGRRLPSRVTLGAAVTVLVAGPLVAAVTPALVTAVQHLGYCPVPPLA